jgi:hypothetical protein
MEIIEPIGYTLLYVAWHVKGISVNFSSDSKTIGRG